MVLRPIRNAVYSQSAFHHFRRITNELIQSSLELCHRFSVGRMRIACDSRRTQNERNISTIKEYSGASYSSRGRSVVKCAFSPRTLNRMVLR